jgi:hypothetical protein
MDENGSGILAALLGGGIFLMFFLALAVLMIAAGWKIFTKAGKPGWAIIVPIYNLVVMLEIVGRPLWWILLMLIPLVNFVIAIIVAIDLAKAFGQGTGFGLGLVFLAPIFYPILGFGSAQYKGPSAAASASASAGAYRA